MPVIFAAHGAPMLLDDAGWMSELASWATAMPKPKSILMVSAHWEERPTTLGATRTVPLVYDFSGFPESRSRIPRSVRPQRSATHEVAAHLQLAKLQPVRAAVSVFGKPIPGRRADPRIQRRARREVVGESNTSVRRVHRSAAIGVELSVAAHERNRP